MSGPDGPPGGGSWAPPPDPEAVARYEGTDVPAARAALAEAVRRQWGTDAREDAKRLVAHAIGIDPSRLAFAFDRALTGDEAVRLALFERDRLAGRTVGRILGYRAFHDITLKVADDVLEPRDDTAALVELALPHLREACERKGEALMLDAGVGAGTVVLAMLAAEPRARGVGTDRSSLSKIAAGENAKRLGLADRFTLAPSHMFGDPTYGPYDVIVSNPPYIRSDEIERLPPEVRADPRDALDGGPDGLRFYRHFGGLGERYLVPGGVLAVEIGAGQGDDVRAIMDRHGWLDLGSMRDLGGHERALAFRLGEGRGVQSGG